MDTEKGVLNTGVYWEEGREGGRRLRNIVIGGKKVSKTKLNTFKKNITEFRVFTKYHSQQVASGTSAQCPNCPQLSVKESTWSP